jgi:hypothetical protein
MPSSQLKRAERAIQTIRDQAELPLETADALQELIDLIRNIEGRLSSLQSKGTSAPNGVDGVAKPKMTARQNQMALGPAIGFTHLKIDSGSIT